MSRRSSSLNNYTGTAITREIDSKYDVIKAVSQYLEEIKSISTTDIQALAAELREAQDFTGITVETGLVASWDPETKTLTVPVEKGAEGEKGDQGEVGPMGPEGPRGLQGIRGPQGDRGVAGLNGRNGASFLPSITYNEVTGDLEYTYTYVDYGQTPITDQEW